MATQAQIDAAAQAANSANIKYQSAVEQSKLADSLAKSIDADRAANLANSWTGSIGGKVFTKSQYSDYAAYAQERADALYEATRPLFIELKAANEKWQKLLDEGITDPNIRQTTPAGAAVSDTAGSTPLDASKAARITAVTGNALDENYDEPRLARSVPNVASTNDDSSVNNSAVNTIVDILKPRQNPLHEYATYTYGITLYMLTTKEFEELQTLSTKKLATWNPSTVLISSAGKFNSTTTSPGRQPEFTDDFYFEDLKINTVIGLNSRTRGTNAIDFSFTIIEPYGLTLLDRLIEASRTIEGEYTNYIDQPYLLELDFYGTTDLGETTEPISKLKKRFPIKFAELKIRAESRGSTYTVKAYPFNHAAFNEIAISTPVTLAVSASNLGNFFASTSVSTVYADKQIREKKLAEAKRTAGATNPTDAAAVSETRAALATAQAEYSKPYNVQSYADALNTWCQSLVGSEADVKDEVAFTFVGFPTEIQASSIVSGNAPSTLSSNVSRVNAAKGGNLALSEQAPIDSFKVHDTTINAGTSIIDVINIAMRNSDYIRNQIVNKDNFRDNVHVDFYKVIPQITKLAYDKKRKRYATKTVYHIVYYRYFNAKHPNLPYTNPSASVKKYDYFYTGKNLDIMDFTINFDTAYYNAVVALPGNYDAGNGAPTGNDSTANRATVGTPDEIAQQRIEATVNNTQGSSTNTPDGIAALTASALTSIYSGSRGDMIQVNIKIIGDPDFIKQDDMYINPGMQDYSLNRVNANGSIAMDYSEVFFDLSFNSPTDMDEATGLLRKNEKYSRSKFSGTYKLIQVSNELSKGQFVQNLTAVRMLNVSQATKTTARQVDNALDKAAAASATPAPVEPRAPDLVKLRSNAAHASLNKIPTSTQLQAKVQDAKDKGADADTAYKAKVNQAFDPKNPAAINEKTLFPNPAAIAKGQQDKTELDSSRELTTQIKRTLTGGR